jgi:hypothetical protein
MMISPNKHQSIDKSCIGENVLRGFGGSGGNRSMMTERGGTGRAASFRITI